MRRASARPRCGPSPSRGVVVLAALEPRVDADRLELHRVQRDLVGRVDGRSRQHARRALDAVGVRRPPTRGRACRPSSRRSTAAHTSMPSASARRTCAATWSRMVRYGKRDGPLVAVGGDARGAGRALAAAEHVRRDHEPAVGVDRRAGADDVVPPAGGRMPGPGRSAHVAVAGEGVQHEHGVVACGVELAPGLVRETVGRAAPARPRCGRRRRRRSDGRRPGRRRARRRSPAGARAAGARRPPSPARRARCLRRSASPSVHSPVSRGRAAGSCYACGRVRRTRRARGERTPQRGCPGPGGAGASVGVRRGAQARAASDTRRPRRAPARGRP